MEAGVAVGKDVVGIHEIAPAARALREADDATTRTVAIHETPLVARASGEADKAAEQRL